MTKRQRFLLEQLMLSIGTYDDNLVTSASTIL